MTAKEYLSQARYLDGRINSKIQQVSVLNALATKCTSTLSDMPKSATPNHSSLEETICKIIDLENEINRDIDRLVDLKREITSVINGVSNTEYQMILEKRYLCLESWEQIAAAMGYEYRYVHKLHNRALREIDVPDICVF